MPKTILRLFVHDSSPRTEKMVSIIKMMCANELNGGATLEVIDVSREPQRAEDEHIIATPTLVRVMPEPKRRVVGDLNDMDLVVTGLDLTPAR